MAYSQVRGETHDTRNHILRTLMHAPDVVDLWDDGSDMVVATYKNGTRVMFYLIEMPITAHEIHKTLRENSQKGMHTLFLFWAEMLLPGDNQWYIPDEWMQAALALYGDVIYAYEVSRRDVYIFPVHYDFQGTRPERYIRWGKTLRLADVRTDTRQIESRHLNGFFRSAFFRVGTGQRSHTEQPTLAHNHSLSAFYTLLGLPMDAVPDSIRKAYRELARQYHPDLNDTPEAHAKMQALNEAYQRIMAQFDQ